MTHRGGRGGGGGPGAPRRKPRRARGGRQPSDGGRRRQRRQARGLCGYTRARFYSPLIVHVTIGVLHTNEIGEGGRIAEGPRLSRPPPPASCPRGSRRPASPTRFFIIPTRTAHSEALIVRGTGYDNNDLQLEMLPSQLLIRPRLCRRCASVRIFTRADLPPKRLPEEPLHACSARRSCGDHYN
jgi:hypothetical protein